MGLFDFFKKKPVVRSGQVKKAKDKNSTSESVRPKKKKKRREKKLGDIIHTFNKISVAVVKLKNEVKVGDRIRIKGRYTDFVMTVRSMQIEHEQVESGKKGQEIAIKVTDRVRGNDKVYGVGP